MSTMNQTVAARRAEQARIAARPVIVGSKFVKGRDVAEIAKDVRRDIKALAGVKATVRISRYSMGRSIDVTITECPGLVLSVRRVLHDAGLSREDSPTWMSAHGKRIAEQVEAILAQYNRDASDHRNDYYEVAFAANVAFCSDLTARQRAEILAAVKAVAS